MTAKGSVAMASFVLVYDPSVAVKNYRQQVLMATKIKEVCQKFRG
ncbi:MEG-2 (ESP15) family [Schistosoma mansoni]|uniref:MEG-2 (ESP15) family n=1 Tax=Schistosoma mansoni TaxID=6183 RepID=C4QPS0_SCHMA|nr:MEG-2 (ESP15) family [Schistosoma mansoni]|eukprot:XP_018644490.1 MEG-2 (ESP15) family [Schistosoma mansoni]